MYKIYYFIPKQNLKSNPNPIICIMPILKDLSMMFFIWLGYHLAFELFGYRQNAWPKNHSFLYGCLATGILQFPIVVIPIGYFVSYKSPLLWLIICVASFLVFIPCYRKLHRICEIKESTVDKEETITMHCITCGRDFEVPIPRNGNMIYNCPVCGRDIPFKSKKTCPYCSGNLDGDESNCPHCGHILI